MGVTKIRNEIEKNAIELIDSLKNICILHNLKRKLVILQIKHKKRLQHGTKNQPHQSCLGRERQNK